MAYQKYAADRIYTGQQWYGPGHVVIADQAGTIQGVVPVEEAGPDVRYRKGILLPGFVNCHVHLELSHLRGIIPQGTGMTEFLLSVIHQRKQPLPVVQEAIRQTMLEMYANGIQACGDICNTADTLPLKVDSPLRMHHFIEVIGADPAAARERYAQSIALYRQFHTAFPGQCSLVPHAPYSVSPALLELILHHPANGLLAMHNQESPDEAQFFRSLSGPMLHLFQELNITPAHFPPHHGRPLQDIVKALSMQQSLLLVHNVTTSKEDVQWLMANREKIPAVAFCLCVRANTYIGNGLPDIPLLMESGFPIVLGTDSLASNTSLSILDEMRAIHAAFPAIPLENIVAWSTINGATALRMHDSLGALAPGLRPGLLCCAHDLTQVVRLL